MIPSCSRDPRSGQIMVVSLLVLMMLLSGCKKKTPIQIGFAGTMTGNFADLGIAGRDGVTHAIEQANEQGGIEGRPLQLITKDDQNLPEVAIQVDRELMEKHVVAIIGHMTSTMSLAVIPLINEKKMLMISPTTSTNSLSGLDDYFIRMTPPNKSETLRVAEHAIQRSLKKVFIVYDLSNLNYSGEWVANFKKAFTSQGGNIEGELTFNSSKNPSWKELTQSFPQVKFDALLIVAGAMDTAMIAQHLWKTGKSIPLLGCGWAKTLELIQNGGKSLEGAVFPRTYQPDFSKDAYRNFHESFTNRFGKEPNFAAVYGYEAASMLFAALRQNSDVRELRHTILKENLYNGLQGDLRMDAYGDPSRSLKLLVIKNGEFVPLD
ncbi:MAG: ABC transporter substrate-binding protein [SAR324 cluster bacterium]|nr:ABC transporter substrate-binding protein [SAR324 cluster bacterium]